MPLSSKSEQKVAVLKQYNQEGNPFLHQFLYPLLSKQQQGDFYTKEHHGAISCWYCGHEIEGYAYCCPKQYYPEEVKFRVSGAYCTLVCVKSQIIFGPRNGNSQQQLEYLTIMADIIYKMNVTALVPIDKLMFEKYGGPISYQWYLDNWNQLPKVFLRDETPFIPTYIHIEMGIKNTSGLNLTELDHKQSRDQQQTGMQSECQSLQDFHNLLNLSTEQKLNNLNNLSNSNNSIKPEESKQNKHTKAEDKADKANFFRRQAVAKTKEGGYIKLEKKSADNDPEVIVETPSATRRSSRSPNRIINIINTFENGNNATTSSSTSSSRDRRRRNASKTSSRFQTGDLFELLH